ncbi:MAG: putative sugar O-methyltransferase [Gammaproteobacteria bacterium]
MSRMKRNPGLVSEIVLPEGPSDYLREDNPRLQELQRRYVGHPASHHSLWSHRYLATELKLDQFRGDNVYVHQSRSASEVSYILTARYVQSVDKLGLLHTLGDDDLFGNYLVSVNGDLLVGRELLDAALEINFLNDTLGLAGLDSPIIIDIGAGYGRLAHRLVQAIPQLETVLCTDAIPESTFLSEFYLRFRGCESKAKVIPLDEVEGELGNESVDLAINVHSFGECPLRSIKWWLDVVSANRIKYFFIVPNGEALGSWEPDNTSIDYLPLLFDRGYKMVVKQPNYMGAPRVQKHGLYPCYYYLFERD